jgi:thiosulfate reductase cytochrome b subunit
LIFPLSTIHISSLADLLGIYLQTCQKIHRATSWMVIILISVHIVMSLAKGPQFLLSESRNLYTMIVSLED